MSSQKFAKSVFTFAFVLMAGSMASAYPSNKIVENLPGVYEGVTRSGVACQVIMSSSFGFLNISIEDADGNKVDFDKITNFRLKRTFDENFQFRKTQDKHFDPDHDNAWLIQYVNHGIPSIFGIYPRTDKLEFNWDKETLDDVQIAITYSNGGPFEFPPQSKNISMDCRQLHKKD